MSLIRFATPAMLAGMIAAGAAFMPSAHAMTAKECYANFRAAKKAGSLNGQDYKTYKSTQCGDAAPAAPAAAPATTAAPATPAPATSAPTAAPASTPAASTPAPVSRPAPVSTGGAVFPSAISSKYSTLSAGKGRLKTCTDQYNANKASGANGGLKWIVKGGGYWSECNRHLKG